jgi:hypothetical protein
MGVVASLFGVLEKVIAEHDQMHGEGHDDCLPGTQDVPMTNEKRAELLYVFHEGRKHGILDDEDELDLEMAVGTAAGDPESFGWPDTTTMAQRIGIVVLSSALNEVLNQMGPNTKVKLRVASGEGGLPPDLQKLVQEGRGLIVEMSGEVVNAEYDHPEPAGPKTAEPEDDPAYWLKRGYL